MKNLATKQLHSILSEVCTKVIEPKIVIFNDYTLENTKKGFSSPHFNGNFDFFNDSFNNGTVASLGVFSENTLASLIENEVKILICSESLRFLLWSSNGQKICIALDGIWIMTDTYRKTNDQNNTTKYTSKSTLVNGMVLSKVSFNSEAHKATLQKHIDSGKIRFIPNCEKKVTKQDKSNIMKIANLAVILGIFTRRDAMIKAWEQYHKGFDLSEILEKGKERQKEEIAKKEAANEERRIIELIPSLESCKTIQLYRVLSYKSFIISKLYEYRETKVMNFEGNEYLSYLEPLIYELSKVA